MCSCVPARDRVLSKTEHALTIEGQAVKLKVLKPSSDPGSHTEETQKSVSTKFDLNSPVSVLRSESLLHSKAK